MSLVKNHSHLRRSSGLTHILELVRRLWTVRVSEERERQPSKQSPGTPPLRDGVDRVKQAPFILERRPSREEHLAIEVEAKCEQAHWTWVGSLKPPSKTLHTRATLCRLRLRLLLCPSTHLLPLVQLLSLLRPIS